MSQALSSEDKELIGLGDDSCSSSAPDLSYKDNDKVIQEGDRRKRTLGGVEEVKNEDDSSTRLVSIFYIRYTTSEMYMTRLSLKRLCNHFFFGHSDTHVCYIFGPFPIRPKKKKAVFRAPWLKNVGSVGRQQLFFFFFFFTFPIRKVLLPYAFWSFLGVGYFSLNNNNSGCN